jgi:D-3-phosphoglycerate dehydrogenase
MTTVLCAGDLFITADTLGTAARAALGDIDVVPHSSRWPDDPFGAVEGVREAAGDPAELARAAGPADVLLTHLAPVTASVLAAAPRLRLVGVTRGGPVNVDLAAATGHGVPVCYLPGRNLGAVAEYAVGLMIAVTRNVGPASRTLAGGRWDGSYFRYGKCGPELRAATVGLVGLGAIGRRVAELLGAFGATVLAHDPYAVEVPGVRLVGLPELLAGSDIVSVHARLTDDTRAMFGPEAFAAMRPGAYFINTSRGELVDEAALRAALDGGRLRGAALDVFAPEPPDPAGGLLGRDDVLTTPHLAGASRQVAEESAATVARAVAGYLRDGRLEHCANPEVLTGAVRTW